LKMSKFDEMDREIVTAIKAGRTRYCELQGGAIWELANAVGPKDRYWRTVDVGRVVDRRLQALRKRGVIHYQDARWSVCTHNAQGSAEAPRSGDLGWNRWLGGNEGG
jgi:hypothetical protein